MPTTEKLLAQMFGNGSHIKLLSFFYLHDRDDFPFSTVSSISKETGLAQQTIRLVLRDLAIANLLDVFPTGQSKIIRRNKNSVASIAFSQFIDALKEEEG